MALQFLTLGLIFFGAGLAWAAPKPPNCTISILTERTSGEKIRMNFDTRLRSAKECATLAQIHRKNFTPSTIVFKSVNYAWKGASIARTKSLALSHRKHPRRPPAR